MKTFGTALASRLDSVGFARAAGLVPDPWQEELLRSKAPRVLINASRQSGKSTTTALLALYQALRHKDSLVLVMAPSLRQSQEFFLKVGEFHSNLGQPLKAFGLRKLSMELTNGSRIVSLPGTERTIRGFSGVSLLILDEAARIEDELYLSVRPMLAVSGGRLIMLSTPWGRRGVFYEEYIEKPSESWERYEVPATMVPRISPEFLAQEREALPDMWFVQEYMCEFAEHGAQFFSEEAIRRFVDVDDVLDNVPVIR